MKKYLFGFAGPCLLGLCMISCTKDLSVDNGFAPKTQTINPTYLSIIES